MSCPAQVHRKSKVCGELSRNEMISKSVINACSIDTAFFGALRLLPYQMTSYCLIVRLHVNLPLLFYESVYKIPTENKSFH